MVMACTFPGCRSTTKLLSLPTDRVRTLRWLQILGLPEDSRTAKLKVCVLHFSPECFTNYTQVQMGFAARLHLSEDALPNTPEGRQPKILKDVGCQTEVSTTGAFCRAETCVNHVKCQTAQIRKHNASTQANRKPFKRSKAIQARAPHRSVECDTSTLEFPLDFVTANGTQVKRFRYDPCSYPDDESNNFNNEAQSTTAADSPESYQEPLESETEEEPVESETKTVTIKVEPEEYEEPLS